MFFYLPFNFYDIVWYEGKDAFFVLTVNIFITLQSYSGEIVTIGEKYCSKKPNNPQNRKKENPYV